MNTTWLRHLLACAFFEGLLACAPVVTTTGFVFPPRSPGCDFQVFTAPPQDDYDQIATVDVPFHYVELAAFKSFIRASVCQAGGDAVYTTTDHAGAYAQAIVLKRTYPQGAQCAVLDVNAPPGAACASTLAPPAFPPPARPATSGCQYDTQCKADRICTDGKCTSPAPSPAPAASAH